MKQIIMLFFIIGAAIHSQAQINIGDPLPSITLQNTTHKSVAITSFKGKYVLIDFWASWCAPCRVGNKKLVKLYKEVNSNVLEIIGISIDTDRNKWLQAIEKDKIKFTQLIDPNGFEAHTAIQFGVEELPTKYLFNPEGILIAKNPTEEEIVQFIQS